LAIENSRPAKRGATVCAYVCTPADVKALKASAAVSSTEAPVALTALEGSHASSEIKRMGSTRPAPRRRSKTNQYQNAGGENIGEMEESVECALMPGMHLRAPIICINVHVAMGDSVLLAISRCESVPAITVHTAWKM
jgi:hypothetical protein